MCQEESVTMSGQASPWGSVELDQSVAEKVAWGLWKEGLSLISSSLWGIFWK